MVLYYICTHNVQTTSQRGQIIEELNCLSTGKPLPEFTRIYETISNIHIDLGLGFDPV